MRRQIGTVNLLVGRVYSRTPGQDPNDPDAQLVYVEAGLWPVYRDGDEVYWEMAGKLSERTTAFRSLGDGLFGVSTWDQVTDEGMVIFTSKKFTSGEFIDFVRNDPVVTGGADARRLIFTLD